MDDTFGVQYGLLTMAYLYKADQMILDGWHRDLCRARSGIWTRCYSSSGAGSMVLALLMLTPNVSVMGLVINVDDDCTKEELMINIWAVMGRSGSR